MFPFLLTLGLDASENPIASGGSNKTTDIIMDIGTFFPRRAKAFLKLIVRGSTYDVPA